MRSLKANSFWRRLCRPTNESQIRPTSLWKHKTFHLNLVRFQNCFFNCYLSASIFETSFLITSIFRRFIGLYARIYTVTTRYCRGYFNLPDYWRSRDRFTSNSDGNNEKLNKHLFLITELGINKFFIRERRDNFFFNQFSYTNQVAKISFICCFFLVLNDSWMVFFECVCFWLFLIASNDSEYTKIHRIKQENTEKMTTCWNKTKLMRIIMQNH